MCFIPFVHIVLTINQPFVLHWVILSFLVYQLQFCQDFLKKSKSEIKKTKNKIKIADQLFIATVQPEAVVYVTVW